ncbi:MAG: hypothetical protein ACXWNK_09040 [Vulcanimicrobiaceae bacterium]
MKLRMTVHLLAAGALVAAPVAAQADNTVTTPLWLQAQNNAVLQSQLNQQAAQQRMQQQLDQQRLTQLIHQQVIQGEQDLNRLQLRFQLDQQSATLTQLLQQQQQLLLNLQQSTKPLPKSLLEQLTQPSPKPH